MAPALSSSRWSSEEEGRSQGASPSDASTNLRSTRKGRADDQGKGIQEHILIISSALARLSLSPEERDAWATIKRRVKEPERVTTRLPELQQIRDDLRELTASVSKLSSAKPSSWAQVASLQAPPLAKPLPRKC
jgi:hypothetical protein